MLKRRILPALSRPAGTRWLLGALVLASVVLYALLWQQNADNGGFFFHALIHGQ